MFFLLGFALTGQSSDENMKETVPAAGACVVTAFIQKRADGQRWLYVANAGDSRAILKYAIHHLYVLIIGSRGGKAIRMTDEHKPNNPDEVTRLKAVRDDLRSVVLVSNPPQLGAFISDDGVTQRVNGMIGITRALGDHMMKELIVNDPHLYATELQPEDKFVILACDGVR